MMYDKNGNLEQAIDRRNISTNMEYNKSDMLVNKTTPNADDGDIITETTYTQFGPAKILVTSEDGEANEQTIQNDYWYHWSGGITKQWQTIDTYVMEIVNTFDDAGILATTTPKGSGTTPWTDTFYIKPQFHAVTADPWDLDNFNRIAIGTGAVAADNIITVNTDFIFPLFTDLNLPVFDIIRS